MDCEEHAQLLALEAEAAADVQKYAGCSLADKAAVQKLSLTFQDKCARMRALTRDLELLAEELDSEDEERQQAAQVLAGHKAEYERLQGAFKAAALAQRTAALRSAAEERKELLSGADAGLRQRKAQTEADAVALAEDVTGGLRRTRQVLAEELEHTSATLAAMEQSQAALGKTRDEYHGQHRHLRKSKGLLGTLNWQAKSETYMLWLGLTVFLAVCAYVFQKRAGHFVPDSLKPGALLSRVAGGGGGARTPSARLLSVPNRQPLPPFHGRKRPPPPPVEQPQRQPQRGHQRGPSPPRHQQQRPPHESPVPPAKQQQEAQQPAPRHQQQRPPLEPPAAQQQAAEPELLEPLPTPEEQPAEAQRPPADTQEQAAAQQPAKQAGPEQAAPEQAAAEAGAAAEQPAEEQEQVAEAAQAAVPEPAAETAQEPEPAAEAAHGEPELAAEAAHGEPKLAAEAAHAEPEQPVETAQEPEPAAEAAHGEPEPAAKPGKGQEPAAAAAEQQAAQPVDRAAGGQDAAAAAEQGAADEGAAAVGPEGAPEPGQGAASGGSHEVQDRQGRRIAVDGEGFVRQPAAGGAEAAAGEEGGAAARDEL